MPATIRAPSLRLARRRALAAEALSQHLASAARRALSACWREAAAEIAQLGALPAESLREGWRRRFEQLLLRRELAFAAEGRRMAVADMALDDVDARLPAEDTAAVAGQVATEARALTDTTIRRVERAWTRTSRPGATTEARLKALRERGDADVRSRAETLARTAAHRAVNIGIAGVYRDVGFDLALWVVFSMQAACPRCAQMDGRIIPLAYGPSVLPPLHPNCKCTLAPVTHDTNAGSPHRRTAAG